MNDEPLARRETGSEEPTGPSMLRDVAFYAVARLVLVAALAALIYGVARLAGVDDFPIYIALAFAIVIALPPGHLGLHSVAQAGNREHRRVRRAPEP